MASINRLLDGIEAAKRWSSELLLAAKTANNSDLVQLCLKVDGRDVNMESDLQDSRPIIDGSPPKNHAFRFSLEESYTGVKKSSWGFRPSRRSIFGGNLDSQDYEEVVDESILKAPICDICIIHRGDPIPPGFYRISKSPSNIKTNLNNGSGGKTMYICIKKDLSGDELPIVNLIVIFPDKNEIIPPGFFVIRRGTQSCNLNAGTNAERVYICYKKDKWGNPITDLQIIFPGKDEVVPRSFSLIEASGTDLVADLNSGTGGVKTMLAYKQVLPRLECLGSDLPDGDSDCRAAKGGADTSQEKLSADRSLSADAIDVDLYLHPERAAENRLRARTETWDTINADGFDESLSPPREILGETEEGDEVESIDSDEDMNFYDTRALTRDGSVAPIEFRRALHPLLVALYVRHGSAADVALQCLTTLLKDTDFFEPDFHALPLSGCTTMLDLVIESVCDRIDSYSERQHEAILVFIEQIIRITGGYLSSNALQRIIRSLFFLCASHSTTPQWYESGLRMPAKDENSELLAFKLLRDLVWATISRVDAAGPAQFLPDHMIYWAIGISKSNNSVASSDSSIGQLLLKEEELDSACLVGEIICDFIDDIIDSVEIARISELVLLLVSRTHTNPTSNKFWFKLMYYSKKLFAKNEYRNVFLILCSLCKMSRMEIREGSVPRDLGIKLIAFEAIAELCGNSSTVLTSSKIMGYQIRRLVVPCVLNNMEYAFDNSLIFSKLLKLISALWKHWRSHLRIEFAILCEHLIIRVLQASPTKIKPDFKLIVLDEVVGWFDRPNALLEMLLNFDMDRKFISHWNVFSHLTRSISALAGKAHVPVSLIGADVAINKALVVAQAEQLSAVSIKALEVVAQIAKTLMDASGHAHLMHQDPVFRSRALVAGMGWEEDLDDDDDVAEDHGPESASPSSSSAAVNELRAKRLQGFKYRKAVNQEATEILEEAILLYKKKGSIKKAVDFLVKKNFMSDTAQEIASFLHLYKNSFDPSAIGDFLGEGGITQREIEYWSQVRFRYSRAISFAEMSVEKALRLFLTDCGFRLPGEAQKIDRFIEAFVKVYWQDNAGSEFCPFHHSDTIHLLSYSLIMLNTDLHRAGGDTGRKKRKKMTKEEFTKNLHGIDQGQDVNREYLSMMYDNILSNPIEMEVHSSEMPNYDTADIGKATSMLKTELIDTQMGTRGAADESIFLGDVTKGLREAEDVLRALAPFTHRFQITGVDINISMDLIRYMFQSCWLSIHAVIEVILKSEHSYEEILYPTLDILTSALTASIFLNSKMERLAFATLLLEYRKTCPRLSSVHIKSRDGGIKDVFGWFDYVQNASPENAMDAISQMHGFVMILKEDIHEKTKVDTMKSIVSGLEKQSALLDSNVYFVREGDLEKRTRSGRLDLYRFFLFSDTLVYAHSTMSGIYRVHEALPLTSMIVADYAEDLSGCSFFITHPIKSFMVQASSATEKREWLRDIQWTIQDSTKRMHESNAAAEQVRAFYSKYNVEKLEDLDYLMSKYKGRELILLEKLELQYGKPGACAPSQALEALSVLSPVPVLNSVSELTVDTAAVVTKHNFISRINDQQKEISEVGKTVLSILSAPTPRETATCTPFQEIIVTKSAVYDI